MKTFRKGNIVQWTVRRPPPSGPGSGRDEWVRFAMGIAEANYAPEGLVWHLRCPQSAFDDSPRKDAIA
jgi:hypothetical protein